MKKVFFNLRKVLLGFTIALLVFTCVLNSEAAASVVDYKALYDTEIHRLLDLTNKEEASTDKASYKLLENIINTAKLKLEEEHLMNKSNYAAYEVIKVFEIIADSLRDENFKIEEITFIAQALEQKTYDCDTGSALYLSILEALNLPINVYMVELPDHVFLRWSNGQEYFNWEVLQSKVVSDEFYINAYNYNQEDIDNKLFMRELNKQETHSHNLQTLGLYLLEKKKYIAAIKHFTEAIELDATNHKAFNNRALVFNKLGVFNLARKDFEAAIKLHPKLAHIYYNVANIDLREGNYLAAYQNYSKALKLDPDFDLAKNNLNLLDSYIVFTGKRTL